MPNWIAGWNMPGYLPESDPWVTADWEAARDYLVEEIERAELPLGDASELDEADEAVAELGAAAPNSSVVVHVGDYVYFLDETYESPEEE